MHTHIEVYTVDRQDKQNLTALKLCITQMIHGQVFPELQTSVYSAFLMQSFTIYSCSVCVRARVQRLCTKYMFALLVPV